MITSNEIAIKPIPGLAREVRVFINPLGRGSTTLPGGVGFEFGDFLKFLGIVRNFSRFGNRF